MFPSISRLCNYLLLEHVKFATVLQMFDRSTANRWNMVLDRWVPSSLMTCSLHFHRRFSTVQLFMVNLRPQITDRNGKFLRATMKLHINGTHFLAKNHRIVGIECANSKYNSTNLRLLYQEEIYGDNVRNINIGKLIIKETKL